MTNIEFYFNRKTTKPPPTIKKWQENLSRERLGKKTRNTKLQKSQTNTHKKICICRHTHTTTVVMLEKRRLNEDDNDGAKWQ